MPSYGVCRISGLGVVALASGKYLRFGHLDPSGKGHGSLHCTLMEGSWTFSTPSLQDASLRAR